MEFGAKLDIAEREGAENERWEGKIERESVCVSVCEREREREREREKARPMVVAHAQLVDMAQAHAFVGTCTHQF